MSQITNKFITVASWADTMQKIIVEVTGKPLTKKEARQIVKEMSQQMTTAVLAGARVQIMNIMHMQLSKPKTGTVFVPKYREHRHMVGWQRLRLLPSRTMQRKIHDLRAAQDDK